MLSCIHLGCARGDGLPDGLYARITVPGGVMLARLEPARAPLTVCSFVGLAEGTLGPRRGTPFFDGLVFHRVVPGFVIQGGDPLGTGEGDPGYTFPDEFPPALLHDGAGVLSMANGGPDTNGSQFFITLDDTTRLNYLHSVFGRLVSGADCAQRVKQGDRMSVQILRIGREAREFRCDEAAFEALRRKVRPYAGTRQPGPGSAFQDPDALLPTEPPRAANFNFKLHNLERSTGIILRAELLAHSPADLPAEPSALQSWLSTRAQAHGTGPTGAYLLYLNDSHRWLLHAPGLSNVRQVALCERARLRQTRNLAQMARLRPNGDAEFPQAMLLKFEVDAWLDEACLSLTEHP
jgi:cyclophilin family peptidyl-prolyl cis-trans isomerase